jgi:hypothetical protein
LAGRIGEPRSPIRDIGAGKSGGAEIEGEAKMGALLSRTIYAPLAFMTFARP